MDSKEYEEYVKNGDLDGFKRNANYSDVKRFEITALITAIKYDAVDFYRFLVDTLKYNYKWDGGDINLIDLVAYFRAFKILLFLVLEKKIKFNKYLFIKSVLNGGNKIKNRDQAINLIKMRTLDEM